MNNSIELLLRGVDVRELRQRDMISVILDDTRCRFVLGNGKVVHLLAIRNGAGLFRKDALTSAALGRAICDVVGSLTETQGFITSDELPRYGLSASEVDKLWLVSGAEPGRDLLVLAAYQADLAVEVLWACQCCLNLLRELVLTDVARIWEGGEQVELACPPEDGST